MNDVHKEGSAPAWHWRIRYALWMWWIARVPLRVGLGLSQEDEEWATWSPRESVESELSYWEAE